MKKFCLFFGVFCLAVAGLGAYLAETKYLFMSFAVAWIIVPAIIGAISLISYVEIRKKRSSGWGSFSLCLFFLYLLI